MSKIIEFLIVGHINLKLFYKYIDCSRGYYDLDAFSQ